MKLLESEIGLISVGVDAPAPVGRLMPAEHSCPGLFAASGSAMAAHKNAKSAMTDAEHDAHSKTDRYRLGSEASRAVPVEIEV